MSIPSQIKIGPHRYTIHLVTHIPSPSGLASGCLIEQQNIVQVVMDQHHTQQCETVLHEALHAIAGSQGHEVEESVIQGLGSGVLDLLRSNPSLVEWLQSDPAGPPQQSEENVVRSADKDTDEPDAPERP